VQDSPGLEVGDDLLDYPSNLVNLGVEFLLPVQQVAMWWFLDWRDHIVADVAFVAYPVSGIHTGEHGCLGQAVVVVPAAVDGVGNPCQSPAEGSCDLDVHAGSFMFA
jgi:hypothetical protein